GVVVLMTEHTGYTATAESLLAILERLRAPGGCPWDREQTRETLARCLAGEVAELLDAIDRQKPADICEELGDVLMNVLFQAVVAAERGEFTAEDMYRGIVDKMIRRHEHIFGAAHAETPDEVRAIWEKVKAREHAASPAPASILDKIPQSLSALDRAEKLQKKAAKVGFDWPDQNGVLDKIQEELDELRAAAASGDEAAVDEEFGDLLFAASNFARFRKRGTSEELLRAANRKFERRFRFIESELAAHGTALESAGLEKLESLWQQAKIRAV
ncbi:MAG: nucleoside triphosphate pyrophosphohydrolase, partial [Victivallaceae bacterium]|nr:nucleoside triphosphate pyrophosphohydrolase [Victivallaceae bacterium]